MTKRSKLTLLIISILIVIGVLFIKLYQKELVAYIASGNFGLKDKKDVKLNKNIQWYDDYYAVKYIPPTTIAIIEPRYWQININYLILGENKALLFDSGPGERDIMNVVKSITKLPTTVMASHFHFDHIGNMDKYSGITLLEEQLIDGEYKNNIFLPTSDAFIGKYEGRKTPELLVDKLIKHGDSIALGNRNLTAFYTPGHGNSSVSLFDKKLNFLFTGDFFYKGKLMASNDIPNTNIDKYRKSITLMLNVINDQTSIYGAHNNIFEKDGTLSSLKLDVKDLKDLQIFLQDKQQNSPSITEKVNDNFSVVY
ncbi:MBL fold metallo-hydrolase [Tenacibaculum xiamenense]|uniref:MBL fold metallo-hydrolase n=1 Tax=Tenacibaculum xiamenense TaxID=1261553 RepID=UPI0038930438